MSTYDFESLARKIAELLKRENLTQSEAARRYGLGASGQATLSKLLRGEPVSAQTARRVGRALGVTPPPRRLVRRCMTREQAAQWDALTHAERDARLGVPSR